MILLLRGTEYIDQEFATEFRRRESEFQRISCAGAIMFSPLSGSHPQIRPDFRLKCPETPRFSAICDHYSVCLDTFAEQDFYSSQVVQITST